MNIRKAIAGLVAVAGLTALAAGSAMAATTDLGTLETLSPINQTVTLTGGTQVNLLTNVFYNGTDYTYQYNLSNLNDPTGIAAFGPTVSNAKDYGTSGLTFFFGGAPTGVNNTVTIDGTVGNDATNVGPTHLVSNSAGTLSAYGLGSRVLFQYDNTGGLGEGHSTLGQYGDYFYISSNTAPGLFDINVTDSGSADFPGTTPGTPEPSSVLGLGIGLVGLLAMGALAVRRRASMLS